MSARTTMKGWWHRIRRGAVIVCFLTKGRVYSRRRCMKIAHIAPPWLAIPPKNYGGTETVISHLVEEQVAQGHEVTLLAPGDAKTSARLISFFDQSLIDSGVPWHA